MTPGLYRGFLACLILLMSSYMVYEHVFDKDAISLEKQMERHELWMQGDAEFFNPWQYRVFAPLILEGGIQIYNFFTAGGKEVVPYLILHFIQMVLILYLSYWFYQILEIGNPFLRITGLMLVCFCIANSTFKSDLSFNTYFDVVFYLMAAILIIRRRYYWIIPVSFVAALNRETSAFIPLMMLVPFSIETLKGSKKIRLSMAFALLLFGLVFISVRMYFGYEPSTGIHDLTSPLDYLKYNFSFLKLYPLLIGTLGIIPLVVIYRLSKLPVHLYTWFWLILPGWVIIHLIKSTVVETRLFLVPQVLILIPALLCIIDKWYKDHSSTHL